MNLGTPSPQTADVAPIGFALDDPTSPAAQLTMLTLMIRPQELSRAEPSRAVVHQTLGGAWADNFGPGLAQITISGHTGWHRFYGTNLGGNQYADGADRFYDLRDRVFARWHDRRDIATKLGMDPAQVRLLFIDGLHKTTHVVLPMSFTLRRSRSQPLLHQYTISMVALGDTGEGLLLPTIPSALDVVARGPLQAAGLASMAASTNKIMAAIASVRGWIDKTLAGPAFAFMQKSAALFGSVQSAIRAGNAVADDLILVARDVARAGQNIFGSFAALASLPGQIKARAMEVAAAYRNIFCVLRNAISGASYYEDYSPLYGTSNCSSTAGGRPVSQFAGANTFAETTASGNAAAAAIPPASRSSLAVLASTDLVTSPMSVATMAPLVSSAAAGIAS